MPLPTEALYCPLCLKHRLKFNEIFQEALSAGFSTNEARRYAMMEIKDRVKKGELDDIQPRPTISDLIGPVLPAKSVHMFDLVQDPFSQDTRFILVSPTTSSLTPLPPNPSNAPKQLRLKPRRITPKKTLPFCKPVTEAKHYSEYL